MAKARNPEKFPDHINKYYVYTHRHPESGDIVYVGMGSYERAWACRGSNRQSDHSEWLLELIHSGRYTMAEIVCLEAKGLFEQDAARLERKLISEINPVFNKMKKGFNSKMTDELKLDAELLRISGMSYSEIAKQLGCVTTMTVHRYLTGSGIQ